eukprot:207501-Rhodomonas_salina.1
MLPAAPPILLAAYNRPTLTIQSFTPVTLSSGIGYRAASRKLFRCPPRTRVARRSSSTAPDR